MSRDLRTAGGLIVDALDMIGRTGVRWWEAEVHRVRGALLITTDETTAAEAFETALDVAREQDAKSLELRAATSLARLLGGARWAKQSARPPRPVYDWFNEGFDTADLKDAKALLDELALGPDLATRSRGS